MQKNISKRRIQVLGRDLAFWGDTIREKVTDSEASTAPGHFVSCSKTREVPQGTGSEERPGPAPGKSWETSRMQHLKLP